MLKLPKIAWPSPFRMILYWTATVTATATPTYCSTVSCWRKFEYLAQPAQSRFNELNDNLQRKSQATTFFKLFVLSFTLLSSVEQPLLLDESTIFNLKIVYLQIWSYRELVKLIVFPRKTLWGHARQCKQLCQLAAENGAISSAACCEYLKCHFGGLIKMPFSRKKGSLLF